jgi:heme exporter protein B
MLAAVKATGLVLLGDPMNQAGSWVALLVCFNLVFWGLPGVLFTKVMEL